MSSAGRAFTSAAAWRPHAALVVLLVCLSPAVARSQGGGAAASVELEPITVVAATPLPGAGVDIDKIPGAVWVLGPGALTREGAASLTGALDRSVGAVSLNDNLDDPFQPDILFRGFEASPVLGTPEGLAVYQNGVRVNEAFGDGLNWDLFPDVAVDRVTVVGADPVYGLNALGGAVVIQMKNGFTYDGGEAELSGGAWGRRGVTLQYGARSGDFGVYLAGRALDEDGWRENSADRLRQFYADVGYHGSKLTLDLSLALADNRLAGAGATPVQELALDRALVFTGPQANENRLTFLTLVGDYSVAAPFSVQMTAYYRDFHQGVTNGNTTNYTACTTSLYGGDLCQADAATPVTGAAGGPIPDLSHDGAVAIGEIDFETTHSIGAGGSVQATDTGAVFGHQNQVSVGAQVDTAHTDFGSTAEVGVINASLVVQPSGLFVATPEGGPWTATPVALKADQTAVGAFATDTFDLRRGLAATASGRYNDARIDLVDQRGEALSGRNRYRRFNVALGFTQKLTNSATLYAGYAEGSRTPTPSEIECANPAAPCLLPSSLSSDPPSLKQVVSHTWEAGLRGRFATPFTGRGRFAWSAGVYRTDLDDDIYGVATSLGAGYFQNIGATRRQGADASLSYRDARLSLYFSYAFVSATFQSALTLASPQNPSADGNGDIRVRPGDVLPGIPAHRVKVGGDLQVTRALRVGAGLVYEGAQYFRGDESNQLAPLPGFAVLDLHALYALRRDLDLFVNVQNATDARYATFGLLGDPTGVGAPGVPTGVAAGGRGVDNRFESPAPPISVFAGVRARF